MNQSTSDRPTTTSSELEASERNWWQAFAELEDRFAWVQTPSLQRILRGHYLREIVRNTPKNGRILELGCGTGWLCRHLAALGVAEVWGVDFSVAQIELAKEQSKYKSYSAALHFECVDVASELELDGLFDCVVVHAVLHHLDREQITQTLTSVIRLLKPNGKFILLEPVKQGNGGDGSNCQWNRWLWRLVHLSHRGRRYGLRRYSPEEEQWRSLFQRRAVGVAPHGPSPKEMPFVPGELEECLSEQFVVEKTLPCMARSHLVTQEWLLRQLSHPLTSRMLLPAVARLASWMDQRLIRQSETQHGMWIFTMFVCRYAGNTHCKESV